MKESICSVLFALASLTATPAQAQIFVPTEEGAALQAEASTSIGASWADYDEDGDLDVAVADISGIQVFRNDGAGTFLLINQLGEIGNTYGTAWGDMDDDGDLDLVFNSLGFGVGLYANVGEGNISEQPVPLNAAGDVRDVSLMDVDRDGLIDMFLARRFSAPNHLLRNEGELLFSEFFGFAGLAENSISGVWGDYNGDGNQDLYTTNTSQQADRLYRNTGTNGLILRSSLLTNSGSAVQGGGASQSANWVDFDRDGDMDLYVGDVLGRDRLYRNDGAPGSGVVEFLSIDAGSVTDDVATSLGSAWGDVDNDGDVDLVVSTKEEASYLHINVGAGGFQSQSLGNNAYGVSPTLVDYDGDGDLDLFITNGGANFFEPNELFRNTTDGSGNWLQIRCVGTTSNRSALGARVWVRSVFDQEEVWQVREVQARSGRQGQSGLRVHFGLADAAIVDSVVVRWPSGIEQVLEGVAPNQVLTVVEEGEAGNPTASEGSAGSIRALGIEGVHPNPFSASTSIRIVAAQAGPVSVSIYDVLGRRVRTLLNRDVQAVPLDLRWDARDEQGTKLAAGTYFVRLDGAGHQSATTITLVR